jgi:hypothetical protein
MHRLHHKRLPLELEREIVETAPTDESGQFWGGWGEGMESEGGMEVEEAVSLGEHKRESGIGAEALELDTGVGAVHQTSTEGGIVAEVGWEGDEGGGVWGTKEGAKGMKEAVHLGGSEIPVSWREEVRQSYTESSTGFFGRRWMALLKHGKSFSLRRGWRWLRLKRKGRLNWLIISLLDQVFELYENPRELIVPIERTSLSLPTRRDDEIRELAGGLNGRERRLRDVVREGEVVGEVVGYQFNKPFGPSSARLSSE